MPRVNGSVPSLVNGVSQQPDSLRLPTQATEQINAISSLTDGLAKRPPLTHIGQISSSNYVKPYVHFINRDANERYVVVIGPQHIAVHGADGAAYPVLGEPDDFLYLDPNFPARNMRCLTVSDTTFVLNRKQIVTLNPQLLKGRAYEALIWVRAGSYSTDYDVKVYNNATSFTTGDADADTIKTTHIADQLATDLQTNLGVDYVVTRFVNTIWIRRVDEEVFNITIGDSAGGHNMSLITDTAPQFSSLPEHAPNGYIARVKGNSESIADDYWVRFDTNNDLTFGPGLWVETGSPGVTFKFNGATLPHQLIRLEDTDGTKTGTVGQIYFAFQQTRWAFRNCGDNDSSPPPSFVNRTIADMFIHRSRLGFLSQGNVCMSQTGGFENFWRQTALALLDDDPIDVYLAHHRAVNLRHAVNFNNQLLLFSDHTQFTLRGGDVLSPKTVSTFVSTEYSSHIDTPPVNAENLVYFPFDDGLYSGVREYYVDANTSQNDAKTITEHCPRFVQGSVLRMSVSPIQDTMFLNTDQFRNRLYVYKWFWNGNEKVQSSWGYWTFGDKTIIVGHGYLSDVMYVVTVEQGGTFLHSLRLDPGATDDYADFPTLLDRKVSDDTPGISVVYDSEADTTTIRPTYVMDLDDEWVVTTRATGIDDYPNARVFTQVSNDAFSITVRGDARKGFWLGRKYAMRYTFSHAFIRSQSQLGGVDTVAEGRLQILDWAVKYTRTGYFRLEITPDRRETVSYPMTSQVLKSPVIGGGLGDVQLRDGVHRVPVLAKNDQVTVRVVNDSHLPSYLSSAEWVANYTTKSRRI